MSFGWSAGDVAAALKLLYRIGNSLREAGGASSEYQDTISFLQTFSQTIQHSHAIQATPIDPATAHNLRDHCGQITGPLQAFLEDANKFESSLGRNVKSKRKKILGTGKKVLWEMVMKNKVKTLQDRVKVPMASISIILGQQILTTVTKMPDDIQSRISGTIEAALSKQKFAEESPESLGHRENSDNSSGLIPRSTASLVATCANESPFLYQKLDRICTSIEAIQDSAKNIPKDKDKNHLESQPSELVLATKNIQNSLWILLSSLHALLREVLVLLLPYITAFYKASVQPLLLLGDHFVVEDIYQRRFKLSCDVFQEWDTFYEFIRLRFIGTPMFGLLFVGRTLRWHNAYNIASIFPCAWQTSIQPKSKILMMMKRKLDGKDCTCTKCSGKFLGLTAIPYTHYACPYEDDTALSWERPLVADTYLLRLSTIFWCNSLDPVWQRNNIAAITSFGAIRSLLDRPDVNKLSAEYMIRVIKGVSNPLLFLAPINNTFKAKLMRLPFAPEKLRLGRTGSIPGWYNTDFDTKVMSRLHAEMWGDEEGRVWIQDARSYHGTWLNGKRLSPQREESRAYEVKTGDLLEMGINILGNDGEAERTVVCRKVEAWVVFAGYHDGSGLIEKVYGKTVLSI